MTDPQLDDDHRTGMPRWLRISGIVLALIVLLAVVLMLTGVIGSGGGGGGGGHTPPEHGAVDAPRTDGLGR